MSGVADGEPFCLLELSYAVAIRRAVDGATFSRATLRFGAFRLDPAQRVLCREATSVALRPKTLEVLLLLLRRAGEVVSKNEILSTVWQGTAVSEYVLTTCVSELRAALGDDRQRPRYLKTVHRSGYQFIAEVSAVEVPAVTELRLVGEMPTIVGRDRELAQLDAALQHAVVGERRIVFISGEMGIGKTTLVDQFVRRLGATGLGVTGVGVTGRSVANPQPPNPVTPSPLTPCHVARGQCIEQFGAGEPYMPVLEAIGRLGREDDGACVADTLRRHAPAWLVQIPGLLSPDQRAELRRELPPETHEHMLRLIAGAIEALSERAVLVLLLEDLHLSDHATLELVTALAQRRGSAHLLIIGTFRSVDDGAAAATFQSIKRQMLLHRQCEEIRLAPLSRAAVDAYLAQRFFGLVVPPDLGATIHGRTEGNPLFIARLVDQLLEDGVLKVDGAAMELCLATADIASHVPRDLRALIEQRADSLAAAEREVLETASVGGVQFWSSSVALALGREREEVEGLCVQLGRRHGFVALVDGAGATFPDLGARYTFSHAVYQQILYERIEVTRRQRLHRDIAAALRRAWGERETEIAGELASHFERGGDFINAIEFFDKAAIGAASHAANREAVGYLDRGLALLDRLEDNSTHRARKLGLLATRGPAALAVFGYASAEVHDTYQRALDLARQLEDPMRQITSLLALAIWHQTRASLTLAEQFALELVGVAERIYLPQPLVAQLYNPLSQVRMYRGAVVEALGMADAAVAGMEVLSLPLTPLDSRPALWADPRVLLYCQRAAASSAVGRLAQAGAALEQALGIAREQQHPYTSAYALCLTALFEDTMGRPEAAIQLAQQGIETAQVYDFPFWEGIGKMICGHVLGWSADPSAGSAMLRAGFLLWHGTGARLAKSQYLNLLADTCLYAKDVDGARSALDEARAHAAETGETVFLPETLRLQAECQRRDGAAAAEVEATLRQAIELSRRHGTKIWELRAALALHRLRGAAKTRRELMAICRDFENEPATRDFEAAQGLLAK